jgi:hypothetical protein
MGWLVQQRCDCSSVVAAIGAPAQTASAQALRLNNPKQQAKK